PALAGRPPEGGRYIYLRRALAVHDLGRELRGFCQIDEVRRDRLILCQTFQVGQRQANAIDVHATEEIRRRLARVSLFRLHRYKPLHCIRKPARGDLRRQTSEARAAVLGSAAHEDEILRHGLRSQTPDTALETERRDVMLAASVRAPADLDSRAIGGLNQIRIPPQMIFEQLAEATR